MQNKEEKIAAANTLTKEVIENTNGIEFIEFHHISIVKRIPSSDAEPDKWRTISENPSRNVDEIVDWIVGVLKAESIQGEFLLMWEDREVSYAPHWAKVSLSDDYEWVKPIWERGHGLYFMPLDRQYLWEIYGMEGKYHATCVELKSE